MQTKTLLQHVRVAAPPDEVYELLLDEAAIRRFTGLPAAVSRCEGGAFRLVSGLVRGTHQVLRPGTEVLQEWALDHPAWPAAHTSEVSLLFEPAGQHTMIHLYQTEIPAACADDVEVFWSKVFWGGLRAWLHAEEVLAVA